MEAAAAIGADAPRARRQRVSEGLALRIADLGASGDFRRGFRAAGELSRPMPLGEAAETVAWALHVDADFSGWASFTHHRPGVGEVAAHSIALAAVDRSLGGLRWFWQCPAGFGLCDALYLPPGADRFASRKAHSLVYRSSSMSGPARAAMRVLRLREALGGAADLGAPLPPRPKRMRAATYARRISEVEALTVEARRIRGGAWLATPPASAHMSCHRANREVRDGRVSPF